MNIPKNSSSWTQTLLAHWCLWQPYNYHTQPEILNKTALVVLRNPISRWVSGICEYIELYHPDFNPSDVNSLTLDWIFDRVAFDDHTERQTMFIESLDSSKIVWFLCDSTFSKTFEQFLFSVGAINNTYKAAPPINTTTDNARKIINTQFFNEQVKNPKYLSKLVQYYQDDFKLINSVHFTKANG